MIPYVRLPPLRSLALVAILFALPGCAQRERWQRAEVAGEAMETTCRGGASDACAGSDDREACITRHTVDCELGRTPPDAIAAGEEGGEATMQEEINAGPDTVTGTVEDPAWDQNVYEGEAIPPSMQDAFPEGAIERPDEP